MILEKQVSIKICSDFVGGDDPGNFAIARKNTFSKHEVKK